jgi:hypothetical protein
MKPTQLPIKFIPDIKQLNQQGEYSQLHSAEDKNAWSIDFNGGVIKHMDNCTFLGIFERKKC